MPKIDLTLKVQSDPGRAADLALRDIIADALFALQPGHGLGIDAKALYDKASKGGEVSLTVEEIAAIKQAISARYIEGVRWQAFDILDPQED